MGSRREVTEVQATFRPKDDQASWTGSLRQVVVTRMLDAGGELIEGTKKVEWDSPSPAVDYFPTAAGVLEIEVLTEGDLIELLSETQTSGVAAGRSRAHPACTSTRMSRGRGRRGFSG